MSGRSFTELASLGRNHASLPTAEERVYGLESFYCALFLCDRQNRVELERGAMHRRSTQNHLSASIAFRSSRKVRARIRRLGVGLVPL